MMIKVDAVSKYGLKVDGAWINWSKGFKPLELRKGDSLDVELDDKGQIIKASLIEAESVSKRIVRDAYGSKDREILRGQCLNLAFQNLSNLPRTPPFDLRNVADRKELSSLAVTLFAELQNAGYLKW